MTDPTWTIDDEHHLATITFPTTPPVGFQLNTPAMEGFINGLGTVRRQMKPEVLPLAWQGGQVVRVISSPAWHTEPDVLVGNTLLHIRDPRFGWLHYMIPREQAKRLATFLQKQVDAPPPGPQSGKPS